jgi:hypothetical protein
MTRSEHNRQAYAQLFAYVGGALQVVAILLIAASFLVIPVWAGIVLVGVALGASVFSWLRFKASFMMPTVVGVLISVMWMTVVGVGFGLLGWTP